MNIFAYYNRTKIPRCCSNRAFFYRYWQNKYKMEERGRVCIEYIILHSRLLFQIIPNIRVEEREIVSGDRFWCKINISSREDEK